MKTLHFFLALNLIIIFCLLFRKNMKLSSIENFEEENQPSLPPLELDDNPPNNLTLPPEIQDNLPNDTPLPERDIIDKLFQSNTEQQVDSIINKGEEYNLNPITTSMDTLNLLKTKCPNLDTELAFPYGRPETSSTIHTGAMLISCLGNWIKYNLYNEYTKNFDSNTNITHFFDTNTKKRYKLITSLNKLGQPSKKILSHNGKPANPNLIPKQFIWNKYIQSYTLCPDSKPIRCNDMCVEDRSQCVKPTTQAPTTQAPTTQAPTTQAPTTPVPVTPTITTPNPIIPTLPVETTKAADSKKELENKLKESNDENIFDKVKNFFTKAF